MTQQKWLVRQPTPPWKIPPYYVVTWGKPKWSKQKKEWILPENWDDDDEVYSPDQWAEVASFTLAPGEGPIPIEVTTVIKINRNHPLAPTTGGPSNE